MICLAHRQAGGVRAAVYNGDSLGAGQRLLRLSVLPSLGDDPHPLHYRLATVRHVDRIIVIAGGRVVESGTHDELQAVVDGTYQRLAALQFRE